MRSWTRFAGALVCVWLAGCVESKTEEGGAEVPDTTQDCIPTSCDSVGASCGLLGDGCGGTLNCGTCAAGTTCGASAANQCATPPPAWGTISWVGLGGPLAYRSVTANPGGTRIFIGTASGGEDRLQALTADNTPVWFQPSEIEITQLRMSPDGLGVFATGYPVRGMPRPELTYRYSLNGANVSLLGNSISDDCGLKAAGTNSGQVALLSTCAFYTTLRLRPSATWEFEPEDTFRMWRVAVDGQGNVLVAGYTTGPTALGDKHFGAQGQRGLLVVKFNPQGGVVWAHELIPEGGEALPSAIAVSSLGTVVVAGTFQGIAHWASKDYDSANGATFLLTLEANGASRWLRQSRVADAVMALDPSGRAFLAGRAADCAGGIRIEELNLAGDPLGTKRLGCGGNLAARDAAALGHDLVLLGAYSGANDFGNGTRTDADGSGTFLLRMSAP